MNTVNIACEEFIKGIYWVYSYYKRLPKDPYWVYPYNYSPTVLDLSNYLQGSVTKWNVYQDTFANKPASISTNPYVTNSSYSAVKQNSTTHTTHTTHSTNTTHSKEFVSSIVQLLSILPPESVELLPTSYQKFMIDPVYGCTHLFPRTYPIQTYLKTHLWECTPVLPQLDIELLEKLLNAK